MSLEHPICFACLCIWPRIIFSYWGRKSTSFQDKQSSKHSNSFQYYGFSILFMSYIRNDILIHISLYKAFNGTWWPKGDPNTYQECLLFFSDLNSIKLIHSFKDNVQIYSNFWVKMITNLKFYTQKNYKSTMMAK